MATDWASHLAAFHAARPGITEDVLARADDGGTDPYGWLVAGIGPAARVLDLACGSGPARPPSARSWVGVDLSAAELGRAQEAGRRAVARADVAHLPVATASIDVATCAMALMLVADPAPVLAEARRVLRPGGELRLLLPARRPLTAMDRTRHLRLMLAARAVPAWPPTSLRRHADAVLDAAGFTVEDDAPRRFALALATTEEAGRYVDSWYRPRAGTEARTAARARAGRVAPLTLGVPLRRVIARRDRSAAG